MNQSASFNEELAGQFLWAPVRASNGGRRAHWETMQDVQPGDVIIHYARKHVRAISRAATGALDYKRPVSLPNEKWGVSGRLIRAVYATLADPFPLSRVPQGWRLAEPDGGPFDKHGAVKQGYLYPLTAHVGFWLETEAGGALAQQDGDVDRPPRALILDDANGDSAEELLRRLIGVELRTFSGSRNLILSVGQSAAIVATDRSPQGQDVEIADVQGALDRLARSGEVEITPETVGHRSSFVGAVLLTLPGAQVSGSPPVIRVSAAGVDGSTAEMAFEGDLSRLRASETRGEQATLRRRLFGTADVAECAICGRTYPVRFLVAAHIKRRAVCSDEERRLLDRIAMPACVFGCDALFELGFLSVDGEGTVVCIEVAASSPAVSQRLDELRGRTCTAHSELSAPYFEWHLRNVFLPNPRAEVHGGATGNTK